MIDSQRIEAGSGETVRDIRRRVLLELIRRGGFFARITRDASGEAAGGRPVRSLRQFRKSLRVLCKHLHPNFDNTAGRQAELADMRR